MGEPSLTLLIPAHDESSRLAAGRHRLSAILDAFGKDDVEVIVIDDGSLDDTSAVARDVYGDLGHLVVVRLEKNRGKGAALRLGMSLASCDEVIFADADMSIHPRHFPDLRTALALAGVAPGDRSRAGRIHYDSRRRSLAGAAFHFLARHYGTVDLRDTQCGAKALRRGVGRLISMFALVDGFAFDVEWLHLAQRLGVNIEPVPVTWDDVSGSSVHVGHEAIQMWRDLRSLRTNRYELPTVEVRGTVDHGSVDSLARRGRLRGLVSCVNDESTLIALPRDGALGGLALAEGLSGTLRTASLEEFRHRSYHAL